MIEAENAETTSEVLDGTEEVQFENDFQGDHSPR